MKRGIIIFALLTCLLLGSGCSTSDIEDQVANVLHTENKYVKTVKGGSPVSYPDITYEEAFENFFSMPTWKYFEGTYDGKRADVVEFTGYCLYQDVEVKASIQFVVDQKEGTFEAVYLAFNDVPQNKLLLWSIITKAFTEAS